MQLIDSSEKGIYVAFKTYLGVIQLPHDYEPEAQTRIGMQNCDAENCDTEVRCKSCDAELRCDVEIRCRIAMQNYDIELRYRHEITT